MEREAKGVSDKEAEAEAGLVTSCLLSLSLAISHFQLYDSPPSSNVILLSPY